MRLTVLTQLAKGLRASPPAVTADVAARLARFQWFCWHGNVFRARQTVEDLDEFDLDAGPEQRKLLKSLASAALRAATVARMPAFRSAERRPSEPLIRSLGKDMLVMADRGSFSFQLWRTYLLTGAQHVPARRAAAAAG